MYLEVLHLWELNLKFNPQLSFLQKLQFQLKSYQWEQVVRMMEKIITNQIYSRPLAYYNLSKYNYQITISNVIQIVSKARISTDSW